MVRYMHQLPHKQRQLFVAVLFFVSYIGISWLTGLFIPQPAILFPATALALVVLFLEGLWLWPVAYLAALLSYFILDAPPLVLSVLPIAQTVQVALGAYLLRKEKIDPLFRRFRDIFFLHVTIFLISLVVPIITSLVYAMHATSSLGYYGIAPWSLRYAGTVFCFLIITPFLLRWLYKPRFGRTWFESLEIVVVFSVLVSLDYAFFTARVSSIGSVPLADLLLVPFFWIALRLRPRFVTLALLVTSLFAVSSLFYGPSILTPQAFAASLYQIEIFMMMLAIVFSIIVSLEEDRRLNRNLMHSQLATLENAVSRISSESRAKNDFIAVLAHELRNPLAPVVSAIDLLKLKPNLGQDEMETLEMMEDRMQTVKRLLDDMLDISRISEGKINLKKARVDLDAVAKHAILSTSHHLHERHQLLIYKGPEAPLLVEGDQVRLEQVISNLLTNASKYSDPGDQITLTLSADGDDALIVVTDQGVGIDPSVLSDIFIPFHQVELGARTKKGLGIGLALVRSFVEIHGGTVTASSKGIGKGSQFTIQLPRLKSHTATSASGTSEPLKASGEQSHLTATTTHKHGLKVLIVDDNDDAAWSMGRLLEIQGCLVSYAYDGKQAVQKTLDMSPDIILLDLGLPDVDGYAVAKTMRARGFHGKIIALTGYSGEEIREKGSHVGFEHYVVKPASIGELKRIIPEIA